VKSLVIQLGRGVHLEYHAKNPTDPMNYHKMIEIGLKELKILDKLPIVDKIERIKGGELADKKV